MNTLPVGQPTPTDPASFTFVAPGTRAVDARLRRGGRRHERQLSFAVGEPDRREDAVERDGYGDDWSVTHAHWDIHQDALSEP